MYHVKTTPGMRNRGPPYSQPQFPGGNWSFSKNSRPFRAASRGFFGRGRAGSPYRDKDVSSATTPLDRVAVGAVYLPSGGPDTTCPHNSVASLLPTRRHRGSARCGDRRRLSFSISCSPSSPEDMAALGLFPWRLRWDASCSGSSSARHRNLSHALCLCPARHRSVFSWPKVHSRYETRGREIDGQWRGGASLAFKLSWWWLHGKCWGSSSSSEHFFQCQGRGLGTTPESGR